MSDTLALSILTLSAVLILIAISGGRFKIFGAEIKGTVGRISRVIAGFAGFLILVVLLIFYIFPKLPDGLFSNLGGEEYPKPIATNPIDGATDVDSSLSEITVTFNKPMMNDSSWTGEDASSFPEFTGKPYFTNNDTICVQPVKLKLGKSYVIWINKINDEKLHPFKDKSGKVVKPYKLVFTTKSNILPKPIATNPINGATDVDSEITVTFNKPMASSWSWCSEGKDSYPELTRKPYFINNDTTCVLPVKLKPGKSYIIWINNERFKNFKDKNENAVEPYKLVFTTRQE